MKLFFFLSLYSITNYSNWTLNKATPGENIFGCNWKVIGVKDVGHTWFKTVTKDYVLKFPNDTGFSINLDRNQCLGEVKSYSLGRIELDSKVCTKVCCDSELALTILSLLRSTNEYSIEEDTLLLKGIGELELLRLRNE